MFPILRQTSVVLSFLKALFSGFKGKPKAKLLHQLGGGERFAPQPRFFPSPEKSHGVDPRSPPWLGRPEVETTPLPSCQPKRLDLKSHLFGFPVLVAPKETKRSFQVDSLWAETIVTDRPSAHIHSVPEEETGPFYFKGSVPALAKWLCDWPNAFKGP